MVPPVGDQSEYAGHRGFGGVAGQFVAGGFDEAAKVAPGRSCRGAAEAVPEGRALQALVGGVVFEGVVARRLVGGGNLWPPWSMVSSVVGWPPVASRGPPPCVAAAR